MIVLRRARFISGGKILRAGEILPDNEFTRFLAEKGIAEIINDTPAVKPAKKSKPEQSQPVQTAIQNDTGNS